MKLGARMLKTGLAVAIAIYVASLIGSSTIFAGMAALFSIQPSIYRSYQSIIEQVQANIIGAISASIIVLTLGNDPFIMGFTIVLVIGICIQFNMKENTVLLALVAVIAIMETTDTPFLQFTALRFSSLMLGVFASFFVNLLFLPPKYETKLFGMIDRNTGDILQWLRITTRHLSDRPALKEEINRLDGEMLNIDRVYSLYQEERTYLKSKRLKKARKLVLFRHLIATTRKAFEVLKTFSRLENEMDKVSSDFRNTLVNELDKVIHAHEKLVLSVMGRIRVHEDDTMEEAGQPNIPKLVEYLIEIYEEKDDEEEKLMFLPLATNLMDYHQTLQRLEKVLSSYSNYHSSEHINVQKPAKPTVK
ncbi:FUSC family protein [Pontibacillus yanchengensis]|uniref:Membrane protein n=1 Tax=Pontibacillus yanchengensis Y32 TaxID=1385514 RepID=A0A0A2TC27_9BACI|nr:aromatic acid exporter family protein [Pontibacillus yanchengensis]KGP71646.1 membrane protein [Pontibacillus yanchengensis Y32]